VIQNELIKQYHEKNQKKKVQKFNVGDNIRVHLRIIEGEKERVQIFNGTVIAKKGSGISETFSVYRHAYGSSMERVFLANSPRISKIEVMRSGKVRRAKLYYIRGASGKAAKIQELLGTKAEKEEVGEAIVESIEMKTDVDETVKEAPKKKAAPKK
jgi:large subunit ribosomal protein L19